MTDSNNPADKGSKVLMPWSPAARLSMLQMRSARELWVRDGLAHGASVEAIAAEEGLAEAEAIALVGELLFERPAGLGDMLRALPI
jgi:hypothetical protein